MTIKQTLTMNIAGKHYLSLSVSSVDMTTKFSEAASFKSVLRLKIFSLNSRLKHCQRHNRPKEKTNLNKIQQCFCVVPTSTIWVLLCSCTNNMAFALFQRQQHGCQWWRQLVRQGEVARILTCQGHINQVQKRAETKWLSEWQNRLGSDTNWWKKFSS